MSNEQSDEIKNFINQLNNIETNNLIQYHNFLRNQIKSYYQQEANEDEKKILYRFDNLLNANTFLMIFSFLEGELEQISKFNDVQLDPNHPSSIQRYEPLINSFDDRNFSESNEWNTIRAASKIRNTLLHCGGLVETSADKKLIEQLSKSSKSGVKTIDGRITLLPEYLHTFTSSVKSIKNVVVRRK